MSGIFDLVSMRARFHECMRARDRLREDMKPLEQRYDALRQQQFDLERQLKPLKDELTQARKPIYELEMEAAVLVRVLNGQTGSPV